MNCRKIHYSFIWPYNTCTFKVSFSAQGIKFCCVIIPSGLETKRLTALTARHKVIVVELDLILFWRINSLLSELITGFSHCFTKWDWLWKAGGLWIRLFIGHLNTNCKTAKTITLQEECQNPLQFSWLRKVKLSSPCVLCCPAAILG